MVINSGHELNGIDLINKVFEGHPRDEKFKRCIMLESEEIYKILSSDKIDVSQLSEKLDVITNIFNVCTSQKSEEFSTEDKLYLSYAFRDIMDEVNLKMHKIINKKNEETHHYLLPFVNISFAIIKYATGKIYQDGSIKIVSEEDIEKDIISKITKHQQSIEQKNNLEFLENELVLEAHKKESEIKEEEEVFSYIKNFFSKKEKVNNNKTSSKIEKYNIKSKLERNLQIKEEMNLIHSEKQERLFEIPSYFDVERDIVNPLYNLAIKEKNQVVTDCVQPFTSENVLKEKKLHEILSEEVVKAFSEESKPIQKLVDVVGIDVVQNIRARLLENLNLIGEEGNIAALTIEMNKRIAQVILAISEIESTGTLDEFIKHLGIKSLEGLLVTTVAEFQEHIRKALIKNVSALCILERQEKESIEGRIQILSGIKNTFTKIGNASSEAILEIILKQELFIQENVNEFMNEIPELKKDNVIITTFALTEETEQINKFLGIGLLFLISSLIENMEQIARAARKAELEGKSTNVSGLESGEQSVKKVKKSIQSVVEAVKTLGQCHKPEYLASFSDIVEELKWDLIATLIESQGNSGLTDIATPLYNELFIKWKKWACFKDG
jgi:hypothetical protein